jgi:hypothetical protein
MMVKIRDLTNKQLMQKIEKYINIYNKLENERQKRLDKFGEIDELLTQEEKNYYDQQQSEDITEYRAMPDQSVADAPIEGDAGTTVDINSFQIDFNDDELEKIQDACKQEISDAQKLETITRILNLSDLNLDKD